MTSELVPFGPSRRPPVIVTTASRTPKLILVTVFKWWRTILAVFVVATLAAGIWIYFQPPQRIAMAKILVKADRTALEISGVAGPSSRMVHSLAILRSEAELFKSRDVLLPVARALTAGKASSAGVSDPKDLETAWQLLALATAAIPISETNVIQVTHRAESAEDAFRALQLILEQYLNLHVRANSGSGQLLDFYAEEHGRLAATLRRHEEELAAWREAQGVLSMDGEISRQLTGLAELERALNQTDADIEATQAKIRLLTEKLRPQPERLVVSQEHVRNPLLTALQTELATGTRVLDIDKDPLVVKLRGDLASAEVALHELLQRYTEKDRRVQEKQQQIAFITKEIAAAEQAARVAAESKSAKLAEELQTAQAAGEVIGRETVALNPLKEDLKRELATAEAHLTSVASRRDALQRQLRETSRRQATLNANQIQEQRLSRLVTTSHDAYLAYAKKLEEARMAAGLDKALLTNVSVVEQPHVRPDTDNRRRLGMLILASVAALWLGLGLAFSLEFVRPSLRIADDVEHYLAIPVLAAVPELQDPPRVPTE